jgi:glycosyltransferase involved in cell wall biosynthesis
MNSYIKDLRRVCLDFGFNCDIVVTKPFLQKFGRFFSELFSFFWCSLSLSFGRTNLIIFVSQEFLCPVFGKKCIVIVHDLIQLKYPRSKMIKFKLIVNFIIIKLLKYKVVVPSNATKIKLKRVFKIDSEVIENIIEIDFQIKTSERIKVIRSLSPKILWIGTHLRHKGLSDIINLATFFPDVTIVLILPDISKVDVNSFTNVKVLSNLTDYELHLEYCAASLFVSTSYDEGYCRPLHEALIFDVPVIARGIGVFYGINEKVTFYRTFPELIEIIKSFHFDVGRSKNKSVQYSNYLQVRQKYFDLFKFLNL